MIGVGNGIVNYVTEFIDSEIIKISNEEQMFRNEGPSIYLMLANIRVELAEWDDSTERKKAPIPHDLHLDQVEAKK